MINALFVINLIFVLLEKKGHMYAPDVGTRLVKPSMISWFGFKGGPLCPYVKPRAAQCVVIDKMASCRYLTDY